MFEHIHIYVLPLFIHVTKYMSNRIHSCHGQSITYRHPQGTHMYVHTPGLAAASFNWQTN